jgi:hypothetical protein
MLSWYPNSTLKSEDASHTTIPMSILKFHPNAVLPVLVPNFLSSSAKLFSSCQALAACSIIPQPTTLPRAPSEKQRSQQNLWLYFCFMEAPGRSPLSLPPKFRSGFLPMLFDPHQSNFHQFTFTFQPTPSFYCLGPGDIQSRKFSICFPL